MGFLALFGVLQGMLDDHEIVDRRRKKRIGVSKKFRTYVHPYEHRPPDGCVSVCRGEHRSSAAGANDNTTPMQIRNPIGYEFASACCNWGDYTADERCSPLHARIGAGAWSRREMRTRLGWGRGWCVAYVIRTNRRGTRPVGVDDHIDPSRSALPGTSGL